jgi:hypothetical protein
MDVLGLLGLTTDVWTECYSCERISWEELEPCNHPFMKFDKIITKLKERIGKNILIHN